jgi:hypothetical protein
MRVRAAAAAAMVMAVACAAPRAVPEGDTAAPDVASAGDPRALLEQHYAAWQGARPASYDYEYRVDCFCIGGGRWYRVRVRDGRVVDATPADTVVSGKGGPLTLDRVPTVDSLYAFARRAYEGGADSVAVEFDAGAHYPTRLFIDQIRAAVDDEVSHSARALTPVSAGSRE